MQGHCLVEKGPDLHVGGRGTGRDKVLGGRCGIQGVNERGRRGGGGGRHEYRFAC